jgi:hypothetical protein
MGVPEKGQIEEVATERGNRMKGRAETQDKWKTETERR